MAPRPGPRHSLSRLSNSEPGSSGGCGSAIERAAKAGFASLMLSAALRPHPVPIAELEDGLGRSEGPPLELQDCPEVQTPACSWPKPGSLTDEGMLPGSLPPDDPQPEFVAASYEDGLVAEVEASTSANPQLLTWPSA